MFNHHHHDALLFRLLLRFVAGIALVDKHHFYRLTGDLLNLLRQFADLFPILLIGRRDMQRHQMPQRIDCQMHFRSLALLGAIIAGPCTDSGVD